MKYMGSKARIAKDILPIILNGRKPNQWYVEPFVGGGNSICEVDGNRSANDINKYVIAVLSALSFGWVPEIISKELYCKIKDNKESFPDYLVGYAGICASYSGKWFGGYAGVTKTKDGIRDYQQEAIKNVLEQAKRLQGIVFSSTEYYRMHIPETSIIYCDQPYKGTTKYSEIFDYGSFYIWLRDKKQEGHTVFISEYSMPEDFTCIWSKEVKSSLSANGKIGGNKLSTEKLFTL